MTPLQQTIRRINDQIHYLTQALPFADGKVYYDDKRKIEELKSELDYWRSFEQYDKAAA